MTTVTLAGLSKTYAPDGPGVFDLNLSVQDGELLVLLGPSGCGKTTTLRLIAGLMRPSSGDLLFDGRSMLDTPPEKRCAAMVFQRHALFPFMSVGDNVAYGLKVRRLNRSEIRKRVALALALVQLPGFEERWPDQLSGGQQQRIALARVLAIEPKVLLLDEPLSNLDRGLREELREVIRSVQRASGITTLLVTHDQNEAVALADRIALMFDGRLHQVAAPRAFYETPRDCRVARFFGGVNFLPGIKQGCQVQTAAGPLEIGADDHPDGEVILTIRPEAIEIGNNGYNNFRATVQSCTFQGATAHALAAVDDVQLQIVTSPFQTVRQDEAVLIHMPRDRICVLPPDENTQVGTSLQSPTDAREVPDQGG